MFSARLGGVAGFAGASVRRLRSRSNGTRSTGRITVSSVTCGWPDNRLRSEMSASTRSMVRRSLTSRSPGIDNRDVVHRHVQRGPQAEAGGAGDRDAVAGVALDPRLHRRGHEARGNADHHQRGCATAISATRTAPAIFSALMSMFQIVKAASRAIQSRVSGQATDFETASPRPKNSPGVLYIYVTYDTFRIASGEILDRRFHSARFESQLGPLP